MKKLLFVAFSIAISLTSCSKFEDVLPDSVNSHGADDTGFDDRGGNSSSSSSSSSTASVRISLNAVPQSAKDYVARNYAGWTLSEAEQELEHGKVQYKLKLRKGKDDIRLIFDANWKFLRVKN